ncbi:adenylosuccinate lyase [Blastopirellula marina]|uniref:Adenylosuccinate lyase n=1 Tax=Blastopirellula marina TaxID=124 RepID=A0A2S8GDZ3_9BACT|nr:adenylosuccinate lyase [Blastopirellula marina]PQO42682.1 adenylosuccinate lyase [Blastopirellula marina]PTL46448.1 adenylosuccinate lyase [Blastopirellula marina]
MSHEQYENPLISRYASRDMSFLWSPQKKHSTWRRLWLALAEAEQELGLTIGNDQLEAMRAHLDDIDFDLAAQHEKRRRHDVMAHVETFAEAAPVAKPIIHLGATSCFVTDNTDLILLRQSLELVRDRLVRTIVLLSDFAKQYRDLPCLGFTHLQSAQPTTIGKRATLWCYDLVLDLEEVEHRLAQLRFRSTKGTTGTQASFLELFQGDHAKVKQLEKRVAEKMGFDQVYAVTGQTYSRKVDSQVLDCLSGIAQSAHKIATDLRILAHRREVEEPIEENQIGSSAMPYKRNPMRSERICGLARYVISNQANGANTLATQWMERTLDDSANRRLSLPLSFLGIDAILIILANVCKGMVVYPALIRRHLAEELPFMATENLMMAAVAAGGDRQDLHEKIRVHSRNAGARIKNEGLSNDLLDRLKEDPAFPEFDAEAVLEPLQYVGRAPEQVDDFLADVIQPIRDRYPNLSLENEELKV